MKKDTKLIEWLRLNKTGVSRDMEHDLRMSQPEVSTTLKKFESQGWLTHKNQHPRKKGHPTHVYICDIPKLKKYTIETNKNKIYKLEEDIKILKGEIKKIKKW